LDSVDHLIAGCAKCPSSLVEHAWTPIGFFGDIDRASAWSISINPSAREFTDGQGRELTGDRQRFTRVADCACCRTRGEVATRHPGRVLDMQRSIFQRVPYRAYFSRLGRFILRVHGQSSSELDPLVPFTEGVVGSCGRQFQYCHVDIVKCATKSPWSKLGQPERELLAANCLPHLERQIHFHTSLRLILVNGRTAFAEFGALLDRLGTTLDCSEVRLASRTATLAVAWLAMQDCRVRVVAWTANVVNQHLTGPEISALAEAVGDAVSPAV